MFVKPVSNKQVNKGQKESWVCINRFFNLSELVGKNQFELIDLLFDEANEKFKMN
jgi:hypothetical protein